MQVRETPACFGEGTLVLMGPGCPGWLSPLGVNTGMFVLLPGRKMQLSQPLGALSLQSVGHECSGAGERPLSSKRILAAGAVGGGGGRGGDRIAQS